tara:strand:- start:85 stop:930 length:846 start_codon:yes stop_codon:yes gene_type:complete
MTDFFSNRELSIIFWVTTILILTLLNKNFRNSFIKLVQTFFNSVFGMFLWMIIYLEIVILLLTLIGFWDRFLIKDSVLWALFVGFPLLMKSHKINSEKSYLRTILKQSLKGIIIIEFIANFYSFSLVAELIIIPIMTFIGLSDIFIKDKPEYKQIDKLFKNLTAIFGFIVLGYTIYRISNEFGEFANVNTLKAFTLPIILTLLFLPYLYFVALWSLYQVMNIRMGTQLKKSSHKRYLKIKLFKAFKINRKKLREFQSHLGFDSIIDKKDIRNSIEGFEKDR